MSGRIGGCGLPSYHYWKWTYSWRRVCNVFHVDTNWNGTLFTILLLVSIISYFYYYCYCYCYNYNYNNHYYSQNISISTNHIFLPIMTNIAIMTSVYFQIIINIYFSKEISLSSDYDSITEATKVITDYLIN